jgi:hypothetical protein
VRRLHLGRRGQWAALNVPQHIQQELLHHRQGQQQQQQQQLCSLGVTASCPTPVDMAWDRCSKGALDDRWQVAALSGNRHWSAPRRMSVLHGGIITSKQF